MNKRILIINSFWSENLFQNYGVDSINTMKSLNIVERFFYALQILTKLPGKHFWDKKKWWNKCVSYDIIILTDSSHDVIYQAGKIEEIVSLKCRLIFFMFNPISYTKDYYLISSRWEKWSFSLKESIEYGFKYGETFYFKELTKLYTNVKIKYDTFFIGLDKGRMKYLNELKQQYNEDQLISLFYIVDNKKSIYSKKYQKRLLYSDVIKLIKSSKSITDVVQGCQEGMTLRVMESIFF